MNINALDFVTRADLEQQVKTLFGSNIVDNQEHTITCTEEDIKRLQLSTHTRIYGVRCIMSE